MRSVRVARMVVRMAIEPIYRKVGERVADFRRSKGLTQEEAAERAGMPRPLWSKLERGRYRVQLHSLGAIAWALGVEVPQLVAPAKIARPEVVRARGGA